MKAFFFGATLCVAAIVGVFSGPEARQAMAETVISPQTVVELFTSQGCSSCPPADATLADLAARRDVLALAWHVDYWDYIGWKDTFGSPDFTKRQHQYAAATHTTTVYTPQFVVQGVHHVVGNKTDALTGFMSKTKRALEMAVVLDGDYVTLRATAQKQPLEIWLVTFQPAQSVKIARGENAKRDILYANIVTSFEKIGQWAGNDDYSKRIKLPATRGAHQALLVQAPDMGPILWGAQLR